MTNLEIVLSVAEAVTLAALVRIYHKHMIVRHLFIRFSDWCGQKIGEMTESASWEIMDQAKAIAATRGHRITDDQARDCIPDVISDAKGEWQDQVDYFQAMLKRNGMARLDLSDLDGLVLNPRMAGLKDVPMPQPRRHF